VKYCHSTISFLTGFAARTVGGGGAWDSGFCPHPNTPSASSPRKALLATIEKPLKSIGQIIVTSSLRASAGLVNEIRASKNCLGVTNIENIYAAGDVIGFPALASTSMEQARRAVLHALGLGESAISPLLPDGIYTIPEVSMVGETEESLKKKGVAYIVGRANYRENARGRIIGDLDGFLN
jgi:pyruvate/2-oxoglutarate dehydrogenase complex dihydrolipoamide dehydrogenase (E3) component